MFFISKELHVYIIKFIRHFSIIFHQISIKKLIYFQNFEGISIQREFVVNNDEKMSAKQIFSENFFSRSFTLAPKETSGKPNRELLYYGEIELKKIKFYFLEVRNCFKIAVKASFERRAILTDLKLSDISFLKLCWIFS